jgi:hypothetical protein
VFGVELVEESVELQPSEALARGDVEKVRHAAWAGYTPNLLENFVVDSCRNALHA